MNIKLTKSLADALRHALPHVDAARRVSGGDGDIAAMNARAALVAYDNRNADGSETLRVMVALDALADYSSAQYVQARELRAGHAMKGQDMETRERFAQGCDIRRRVADELLAELRGG